MGLTFSGELILFYQILFIYLYIYLFIYLFFIFIFFRGGRLIIGILRYVKVALLEPLSCRMMDEIRAPSASVSRGAC